MLDVAALILRGLFRPLLRFSVDLDNGEDDLLRELIGRSILLKSDLQHKHSQCPLLAEKSRHLRDYLRCITS